VRHKHFIRTTDELLKELDTGIHENSIYPAIKDPNKKKCKKKGGKPAPKGVKKLKAKKGKKGKKGKKAKKAKKL